MKTHCNIAFVTSEAPVALPEGANLSEHLTVQNSPILFGCRTGICGTCIVEVLDIKNGTLPAPDADEKEVLEMLAGGNPNVRLACQIHVSADIVIRPFEDGGK